MATWLLPAKNKPSPISDSISKNFSPSVRLKVSATKSTGKKTVKKKVMNAFTGGRVSVEEQRKLGGNPEICSVHAYNTFLFEPDDQKLAKLYSDCRSGKILCGECKQLLLDKVWKFLEEHQRKREKAKDVIEDFFVRD